MKRLLRSYVYNGFVWELNCSTSGELNDDKSSGKEGRCHKIDEFNSGFESVNANDALEDNQIKNSVTITV